MSHADLVALAAPPASSVWLGRLGSGAVWFAVLAFLGAFAFSVWRRPKAGGWAFAAGSASLLAAGGLLAALFVQHRFEFQYVFKHSDASLEPQYLLAAMWGGQEGSFLLWAVLSAASVLLVLPRVKEERAAFLAVSAVFLAGLAAILAYESPFAPLILEGQWLVPPKGQGLTPSLLNYWMVIHPPTIFLGFGALTPIYAWSLAAVLRGDATGWAKGVRAWAIFATTVLGVGLCMGGFWAYETLGWGGFWKWDPVENTSFVPWCAGVALIHGIILQVSRNKAHIVNLWLGAAPFLLFCYGTFLTRSGFLTDASVHSFAKMNRTALYILEGLVGLAFVAFVGAFVWRYKALARAVPPGKPSEGLLSKESFYAGGIWLTCGMGVVTAIGMSVPLIQALRQQSSKVVDEVLYHQVLVWPFVPLMLLMAAGPLLSWKRTDLKGFWNAVANPLAVSIGLTGCLMLWLKTSNNGLAWDVTAKTLWFGKVQVASYWWIALLCFFCILSGVASVFRIARYAPRDWPGRGGLVAHLGLAMTMVGLIASRGYEKKAEALFNEAYPTEFFGRQARSVGKTSALTDRNNKVRVQVVDQGHAVEVRPSLYYIVQGETPAPMKWPYLQADGLSDFYYVVHELSTEATNPMKMSKGQVGTFKGIAIKFEGYRMVGEAGQQGTQFVADMTVDTMGGVEKVAPSITIGAGEVKRTDAKLSDSLKLRLVGIDAGDKSATIQIIFAQPAYPAEIFYKPLTRLVWWGVGIMALGGLSAAWARRATRPKPSPQPEDNPADAIEPVAQV